MIRFLAVIAGVILLFGVGCSGDRSKEIFETAQFEEKQHNNEHAEKLYSELLTKYPKSPLARQAQERLDALKNTK